MQIPLVSTESVKAASWRFLIREIFETTTFDKDQAPLQADLTEPALH